MFSFAGDTVLDPFSGTGSTTLAAMETGRNSIANELEQHYHTQALKRAKVAARAAPLTSCAKPCIEVVKA
jgi:site-specific DNA-methyltransferase (adenine-specific)